MSEKERACVEGIAETLTKLEAARGPEYVKGLLDGIGIGTAPGSDVAEPQRSE